jgi:glycine betaine/proline transport system substrate-binding protein
MLSKRAIGILGLFLIMVLVLMGCQALPSGQSRTIKLARNPWLASWINAALAEVLLEEKLGYQAEIVEIAGDDQWSALASGDLDASLEVWPSGHKENIVQYVAAGQVEDLGPLGPVGKIGWYIPGYLLQEHPELTTWEGLANPEIAALFRTEKSGEKGQFLAGDPTWTQYDQQIIDNLGLDFQVVFAGSEKALLEELGAAYEQKKPLLFYFYTPHSAFTLYDLVEIKLPPFTDECQTRRETRGEGVVNCDYPPDILLKVANPRLQAEAPEAYHLLKEIYISTDDQTEMIAAVELEGKTVEQAVRAWLDRHERTWQNWLP